MAELLTPENLIALLTLTSLEIVLGIDNIIFITILASRLPIAERARARTLGLAGAFVTRVILLFAIGWVIGLTAPLFTLPILDHTVSGRDLVLILGGLFLLAKSTHEIHKNLAGDEEHGDGGSMKAAASFVSVIVQIMLLDIVFSLDSVITAVGMVDHIAIMIVAVVIAIGIMMWSAGSIGGFVERHPTIKILALSFLLMIGFLLVTEGFHVHVPKGYVYFAMAFSLFVEVLNMNMRKKKVAAPVHLRAPSIADANARLQEGE
jgi:predicted tellurium resistance membrane protein TerC